LLRSFTKIVAVIRYFGRKIVTGDENWVSQKDPQIKNKSISLNISEVLRFVRKTGLTKKEGLSILSVA